MHVLLQRCSYGQSRISPSTRVLHHRLYYRDLPRLNVSLATSPHSGQTLSFFLNSHADVPYLIRTLVSHAATLNRNKLVEMIHVKQQLWRTLAQKEAVEATVALQTEFT